MSDLGSTIAKNKIEERVEPAKKPDAVYMIYISKHQIINNY